MKRIWRECCNYLEYLCVYNVIVNVRCMDCNEGTKCKDLGLMAMSMMNTAVCIEMEMMCSLFMGCCSMYIEVSTFSAYNFERFLEFIFQYKY